MEGNAYHGTKANIESEVLPPTVTGNYRSEGGRMFPDVTFFSVDEKLAWDMATRANQKVAGRPRVYTTQPVGETTTDPVGPTIGPRKSFAAPKQKITDVNWIPTPPEGSTGVQGTLPEVDWTQYGGSNYDVLGKVNKEQFNIWEFL
jgi:hypothetical protein